MLPAASPLKVVLVAPVCVTVPFKMNVYGPVPLFGVIVMLPFVAPEQEVPVGATVAVTPVPVATAIDEKVAVQPLASVTWMECEPAATPVKVVEVAPVWVTVPFKTNV